MRESYTFSDLRNWAVASAGIDPPIRLGVFGDPIEHSRSPQMQNAALHACGIAMQYARFQIKDDELEAALRLLPALDFVGVNLTIPHKITGAQAMDELDGFAGGVNAVNTVRISDGKLVGYNTDGPGFSRAVRSEFSVELRDLRVLLFGAGGGVGRAIAMQSAVEGCKRLALVNRTPEKVRQLAAELRPFLADTGVARVEAVPWDDDQLRSQIAHSDLIVNATALGMLPSDFPVLKASLLAPHLMIYDTVYGAARTPLLDAAHEAGARAANGLSMLLHQGALAFETWFNRDAPLAEMRAALAIGPEHFVDRG